MEAIRVHELARQIGVTSRRILAELAAMQESVSSASSLVAEGVAAEVRSRFGLPSPGSLDGGVTPPSLSSWRAGAIRPPVRPDLLQRLERLRVSFAIAGEHQDALSRLGSQFVYASPCQIQGVEDCGIAYLRFSGAIEAAFGLTREVMFFYSPHRDLQIRTMRGAKEAIARSTREITPDMIFMWAPDPRLREKLDDWSSGKFMAIPLTLSEGDDPVAFVSLLRDYIFARDLFYETTPVRGERFFGRRRLLQSLREDVRNNRVSGLFGLRKAGKTSVLSELSSSAASEQTIVILRDLESLPSPPADPVPDLLYDLLRDLVVELSNRSILARQLTAVKPEDISIAGFKRIMQQVLLALTGHGVRVVLMLDEIEYLTPSDQIDIREGNLASVAQFLGMLRSLVQENENFTFLLSGLTSEIIESGRLYGRPNPLFSWAKAYYLAPFEQAEADDLARSVGRKMGIEIDDGALEALFEASGGHAFLYRHLASTVVSDLPVNTFHRRIRRADVLRAYSGWRQLVAGNMQEMLNHLKRYYPDEAYLIEVLMDDPTGFAAIAPDAPLALGHLRSLGLVTQEANSTYELTTVLQLL